MIDYDLFEAWTEVLGEDIPVDFQRQNLMALVESVSVNKKHEIWVRFLFNSKHGNSSAINTKVEEPPPPEGEK